MNKNYEMNSLPPEFLCSLCKKLVNEPVTCAECLAVNFCLKCAEESRQKKSSCPICKAVWCDKSLKSNPFFQKIYDLSEIQCPNNECKWQGSFKEYFLHQEECLEKIIECPLKKFGCSWQGNSKFHLDHHRNSCIYAPFKCYFEQIEGKLKEISEENKSNLTVMEKQNENITALKQTINEQNKAISALKVIIQGRNLNFSPMSMKQNKPPAFQGILRNLSMKSLLEIGFKLGLCELYSSKTSADDLVEKYKNKKFVILGGKEKGEDKLILAAMGDPKEVFKETMNDRECHYHNGVYWYFMKGKAAGFSFYPNVYLYNADWIEGEEHRDFEDDRLSWHLTGNGGWRLGKIIKLSESDAYEKVLLFWD